MTIPKEMLREYINAENFKSTTDIIAAIKELFAQVLQGVMDAELETTLGYSMPTSVSAISHAVMAGSAMRFRYTGEFSRSVRYQ